MGHTSMSMTTAGLLLVAGCSNSPRITTTNTNMNNSSSMKFSCYNMPTASAVSFNLGLAFWLLGGEDGVGLFGSVVLYDINTLVALFSKYDS